MKAPKYDRRNWNQPANEEPLTKGELAVFLLLLGIAVTVAILLTSCGSAV